jgi:hypothetical protein
MPHLLARHAQAAGALKDLGGDIERSDQQHRKTQRQ